jgi:hypothetical protein
MIKFWIKHKRIVSQSLTSFDVQTILNLNMNTYSYKRVTWRN